MKDASPVALLLVVFIVVMFLIPFGLVAVTVPAEPYRVVSGEPLREAAQALGIQVCNVTEIHPAIPGATNGKIYELSRDCNATGGRLVVVVQGFDSIEARDAAIRNHLNQPIGRGKPSGNLIVHGQYLIYVQGLSNGEVAQQIAKEIRARGG